MGYKWVVGIEALQLTPGVSFWKRGSSLSTFPPCPNVTQTYFPLKHDGALRRQDAILPHQTFLQARREPKGDRCRSKLDVQLKDFRKRHRQIRHLHRTKEECRCRTNVGEYNFEWGPVVITVIHRYTNKPGLRRNEQGASPPFAQDIGRSQSCVYIYIYIYIYTGWWLTYPFGKYDSVSWDDDIPNWIESQKYDVPNTNQYIYIHNYRYIPSGYLT